jgi:hypothetical protein
MHFCFEDFVFSEICEDNQNYARPGDARRSQAKRSQAKPGEFGNSWTSRHAADCACLSFASAAIAQLGERQTEDLKVPGSIPGLGTFLALAKILLSNFRKLML